MVIWIFFLFINNYSTTVQPVFIVSSFLVIGYFLIFLYLLHFFLLGRRHLLVTNVWGSLAFSPAKLERCGASRNCPSRTEHLVRPVRNQQSPVIAFSPSFLVYLLFFYILLFFSEERGRKKQGFSFLFLSFLLFLYFVLLKCSHLVPYNYSRNWQDGFTFTPGGVVEGGHCPFFFFLIRNFEWFFSFFMSSSLLLRDVW